MIQSLIIVKPGDLIELQKYLLLPRCSYKVSLADDLVGGGIMGSKTKAKINALTP